MSTIEQRAKSVSLSRQESQVLDYVLKNKQDACFLTSNEIAARIGTSPSSVVRFSKRLGFASYTAFRKALQVEVSPTDTPKQIPYEKIHAYQHVPDLELLHMIRQNTISNLQKDASTDAYQKLILAADLVTNAKRVFVVGFRACAGFASSLGVMLSCIRPGVFVMGGQQPLVDCLIDLSADDVMIAISFQRYSSDTIFAVKMAADAGCQVIAMTDSYASPIAEKAAAIITSSIENMSFYNSYASFVANMEAMVLLVSKRNKSLNESRLMRMESYLEQTGQY